MADFISGIEIGYGSALVPRATRHVTKSGAALSLAAPGASAGTSYLWLTKSSDTAIVEVTVLYDDEATPVGFTKVARDLSGGAAAKVFLAYRTAPVDSGSKPVAAIHLLTEGETADAGVQVLERSLTRAGPAVRLGLQFGEAAGDSAPSAWAEGLKVGDILDCMDKGRRWRAARVAALSPVVEGGAPAGAKLTISFKGWSAKHDEEVPRNSKRLARPGTHTAGKDTRAVRRQGEAFDVDLEVLASLELRIDDYIAGEFPPEERDAFAKGELPSYLETVLSSKYESDELKDRINAFNQKVLQLCVHHMRRLGEPLPPEVRQHLQRLFLDDSHCDYYFQHYGGTKPDAPIAGEVNGVIGRLPGGGASRYYVGNLNHFYALGGYDVMRERLCYINACGRAALAGEDPAKVPVPCLDGYGTVGRTAAAAGAGEEGGDAAPAAEAAAAAPAGASPAASTGAAATPAAPAQGSGSSYGPLAVDDEAPLAEAYTYAAVLKIPQFCYTETFATRYYQPLRDALLDRALTLSDAQLKRAPRETMDALKTCMNALGNQITKDNSAAAGAILAGPLSACAGDTTVAAAIERWSLRLSLRLLRCDSLALRVKGVTEIRDMVEAVEAAAAEASGNAAGAASAAAYNRRGRAGGWGMGYYQAAAPVAAWFDAPKLLAWLKEHKVVSVILGDKADGGPGVCDVHVQTLSRLQPIVAFLAKHDQIAARRARVAAAAAAEGAAASPSAGGGGAAESKEEADAAPATTPGAVASAADLAANAAEAAAAAANVGITRRHIDRLFAILEAEWHDDELRKAGLEVLAAVFKAGDLETLRYVYAFLKGVPFARYDEAFVATLQAFTNRALAVVAVERAQRKAAALDAAEAVGAGTGEAGDASAAAAGGEQQAAAAEEAAAVSWDAADEGDWFGLRQLWELIMHLSAASAEASAAAGASASPAEGASPAAPGGPTQEQTQRAALLSAATEAIIALVKFPGRYRQLGVLLDRAVAGVAAGGAASLACLKLADSLLRSVPLQDPQVPMSHCAERTVERLQARFNLTALLVEDMGRYKVAAAAAARRLGLLPPVSPTRATPTAAAVTHHLLSTADAERIRVGGASHAENVDSRLAFYLYALQQGDLALSFEDVRGVWAAFVDGALSGDERETLFTWIFNLRFRHATPAEREVCSRLCPLSLAQAIFKDLFCDPSRFPVAAAGPQALRAFTAFFRLVNHTGGATEEWSDEADGFVVVDHAAFVGLDTLWSLALHCGNREVSKDATAFLISLHTRLRPAIAAAAPAAEGAAPAGEAATSEAARAERRAVADAKRAVWDGFVARCMHMLRETAPHLPRHAAAGAAAQPSAAAAATAGAVASRQVAKVLRLLTAFLAGVEAPAPGEDDGENDVTRDTKGNFVLDYEGPSMPGAGAAVGTVKMWVKHQEQGRDATDVLLIKVRKNLETVGTLRDRVADVFSVPVERVRISDVGQRTKPYPASRDPNPLLSLFGAHDPREATASGEILPEGQIATEGAGHVYADRRARIRGQLRLQLTHAGLSPEAIDAELAADGEVEAIERSVAAAPRAALSRNAAYFDALFELLSSASPAIVAVAWELVQTLPVNAKVQADIHTLRGRVADPCPPAAAAGAAAGAAEGAAATPAAAAGGEAAGTPDWDAIFDGAAPLKLLYSLQIAAQVLDHIAAAGQADAATAASAASAAADTAGEAGAAAAAAAAAAKPAPASEMASPWARAFVRSGGLAHLHKLIMTADMAALLAPSTPRLLKECARLLVSTYARFVVAGAAPAAPAAAAADAPASASSPNAKDAKAAAAAEAAKAAAAALAAATAVVPAVREFTAAGAAAPVFAADRGALAERLLTLLSFAATGYAPGAVARATDAGAGDAEGDEDAPVAGAKAAGAKSAAGAGGAGGSASGGGNWYSSDLDDEDAFALRNMFSLAEDDEWEEDKSKAAAAGAGAKGAADAKAEAAASPLVALTGDVLRLMAAALVGPAVATPVDASDAAAAAPEAALGALKPQLHAGAEAAFTASAFARPAIVYSLLAPAEAPLRDAVSLGLQALHHFAGAAAGSGLPGFLLAQLLEAVETAYAFPETCPEFFALLAVLLTPAPAAGVDAATAAAPATAAAAVGAPVPLPQGERAVVRTLAGLLRAHPVVEVGSDERDVRDNVLGGLLNTLRAVLRGRDASVKAFAGMKEQQAGKGAKEEEEGCDLIEEVFERCLFAMPNDAASANPAAASAASAGKQAPAEAAGAAATAADAPAAVVSVLGGRLPKCKMTVTRKAAFGLLYELAVACEPTATRLCEKFLPHHDADAAEAVAAAAASEGGAPAGSTAVLTRAASGDGRGKGAGATSSTPGGGGKSAEDEDGFGPSAGGSRYQGISSTDFFRGEDEGKEAGKGKDGAPGAGANANMSGRSKNLVASRSSTGYVGLRNLGCICYMNSTMQQFFMNPAFRRGVLQWAEPAATPSERAESLMYQMQRQFASLQESEKQYYNPRGLCHSIKDWDGNPTDVGEQKDVPEFLTKLFSDMETQCQGTRLASLAKDVYGCSTMSELIADNPQAAAAAAAASAAAAPGGAAATAAAAKRLYSSSDSDNYFLQVSVKKPNLLAALHEFISGETVEYKWDLPAAPAADDASAAGGIGGGVGGGDAASAEAKKPAAPAAKKDNKVALKTTKRVSIKTVSDHLMIHLSRFEFDVETMQQKKVNSRFEFPQVLDLWPYTVWGRPDAVPESAASAGAAADEAGGVHSERDPANYVYELVGMVIHTGTAIGGHYYSYIRERDDSAPGPRWFEFNDQTVTPWAGTPGAMDRDCFGGKETVNYPGYATTSYYNGVAHRSMTQGYTVERERSASAFCLFYDRVKRKPAAPAPALPLGAAGVAEAAPAVAAPAAAAAAKPSATGLARTSSAGTSAAVDPRALFVQKLQGGHGGSSDRYRAAVRAPVPPELLAEIQSENIEFWRLRTIYDLEYFACLRELVRAVGSAVAADSAAAAAGGSKALLVPYPASGLASTADAMRRGGRGMPALRLAVNFMLNTLTDSNQKATLPQWLEAVQQIVAGSGVAAAWLLQWLLSDTAELRRLLITDLSGGGDCMRETTARLLAAAAGSIWPAEQAIAASPEAAAAAAAADAAAAAAAPSAQAMSRVLLGSTRPLAGAAGKLVPGLLDWLLEQLPRLHRDWRRFSWFFWLLNALAGAEPSLRAEMIRRQLVARLIDFALSGDGPHPELNDGPAIEALRLGLEVKRDSAGRVVPTELRLMGDSYSQPDFEALFLCLRTLITSCKALSGRTDSTEAQPPQVELGAIDIEEVTCKPFLNALAAQLARPSLHRLVAPLLKHLFWGVAPALAPAAASPVGEADPAAEGAAAAAGEAKPAEAAATASSNAMAEHGVGGLLEAAIGVVTHAIKVSEWYEMRPFMRFATLLCDVAGDGAAPPEVAAAAAPAPSADAEAPARKVSIPGAPPADSLQAARVSAVCRGIVGALKAQLRFWQPTELGIELFTKLAKDRPAVRQWMVDHAAEWRWCLEWYNDNARPSNAVTMAGRVDDGVSPRFLKRGVPSYSYAANPYSPMRDRCTHQNLRDLLEGYAPEFDMFDAGDDPLAIIGRRVRVEYVSYNARVMQYGVVVEWDAARGQHALQMAESAGGAKRWLDLTDTKTAQVFFEYSEERLARTAAATAPAGGAAAPAAGAAAGGAAAAQQVEELAEDAAAAVAAVAAAAAAPRVAEPEEEGKEGEAGRAGRTGGAAARQRRGVVYDEDDEEDSDSDGADSAGAADGGLEGGAYDDEDETGLLTEDGIAALHLTGEGLMHLFARGNSEGGSSDGGGYIQYSLQRGDSEGSQQ